MRVALGCAILVSLVAGQPPPSQTPVRDSPRPASTGTAAIVGRIVVLGTTPAVPVRRARVSLNGDSLGATQFTDTDTDGRYRFDQLPAGSFRITAEKPGYVTLEYGATRPFARPAAVEVKDGQTKADFGLPRGAALEGRLVNEANEPVANMTVSAVRFVYGPDGRKPAAIRQARTDDLGRFRVHSLPPGEYFVDAVLDARSALDVPGAPGNRPPGYARTYFPGTLRLQDARSLRLSVGQDLGNLDFHLTSVPLAQVTVQVLDSSGKPAPLWSARLQRVGGPPGEVLGLADSRVPGTAAFESVPPGEYWLVGSTGSAPGAPLEFSATRITVAGQDSNETVRTEPGARIDGRLDVDAVGAPPALAGLRIAAYETEYELPIPGGARAVDTPITVGADGRFSIPSVLGPRIIRLQSLPRGWALKSVWLDDREVSDSVTDFRPGAAPRMMRVVITDRTAQISGTVTDDRKRAVDDYRVVILPEDERLWTPRSRLVKHALPSVKGAFAIDGLLPGKYVIAAVEYLEDDSWNDPELLRRLRSIGTPVALAEGQTQTVTLTVKVLP